MKNCKSYNQYIIAIISAVVIGAVFFTIPRTHDDYWYMRNLNEFGTMPDGSFNFIKGVIGTAVDHHHNDNSRLPNFFGAALISLPSWFLALISALSIGFTVLFMQKLADGSKSVCSIFCAALLILLYSFVMPWDNMLFSGMFTYNYIWTVALMTAAVWLFIRKNYTKWYIAFVLGLILGTWHEIFAFPTLVGALLCFAFNRRMIRSDRIFLCLGLVLGCLWLWMSPSRTSESGYGSYIVFSRPWRDIIGKYWFPFIYLSLEALCLLVRPWRKLALAPVNIFAVSSVVVCLPIMVFAWFTRVIVPAVILSSVGLVYLISHIFPSFDKKTIKGLNIVGGLLFVFLTIHYICVFALGIKLGREENYIISEYHKSKDRDGIVFAPLTKEDDLPWLTFGKPYIGLYDYYSHSLLVSMYYGGEMLKVIPIELKDYRGQGDSIPGANDLLNYKGNIVGKYRVVEGSPVKNGFFRYADGREKYWTVFYPFTGADSCKYVYLTVSGNKIKSIDFEL